MEISNRDMFGFIQELGSKVEAKSTTVCTGVLYMHRLLKSAPANMFGDDKHTVAAVCLYLAGKVDEDFIRIRDIINVTHRMLHPNEQPLDVDELYWEIREGMGRLEMLLLRYLAFRLQHEHPHKYLLHYLHAMESWLDRDTFARIPLARTCWSLLNDCYLEPEFILETKPQHIAASIIHVVLTIYGLDVPYGQQKQEHAWYAIMCELETKELNTLTNKIMDINR